MIFREDLIFSFFRVFLLDFVKINRLFGHKQAVQMSANLSKTNIISKPRLVDHKELPDAS